MRKNLIIGVLAVAIIVLGVWGYNTNKEGGSYKTLITNNYEDNFITLQESLKNMESSLSKALVATNDSYMRNVLLDVWRYSISGSTAVSNLPLSHVSLQQGCEVITQAGDYCYSVAQKVDSSDDLTKEEMSNLQKIKDSIYTIMKNVQSLSEKFQNGEINFLRDDNDFYLSDESEYAIDTVFSGIDKSSMEYPKLIYDGPFSEALKEQGPKMDLGEKIDETKAKELVAEFLNNETNVEKATDDDGVIPCYVFESNTTQDSKETYYRIKISKEGGHVIQVVSNRDIAEQKLSLKEAQAKAKDFLEKNGFENMSENYYETYGNKTVFNFVYEQNNVIIYPDLVKVQVALDNGEIVGFEASTYYMRHYDRDIPAAKVTMQQAQKSVSSSLELTSKKLAVIPLDGGSEVLCYEFKGKTKDDEWYIVYINADTGKQQQILKIIEANESVLTL